MTPDIDGLIYLNDDVLLYEDTLDELFKTYQKYFPDFDGVMGINQINLPKEKTIKTAFGVIGREYSHRFPNKQIFCPDFSRFLALLKITFNNVVVNMKF